MSARDQQLSKQPASQEFIAEVRRLVAERCPGDQQMSFIVGKLVDWNSFVALAGEKKDRLTAFIIQNFVPAHERPDWRPLKAIPFWRKALTASQDPATRLCALAVNPSSQHVPTAPSTSTADHTTPSSATSSVPSASSSIPADPTGPPSSSTLPIAAQPSSSRVVRGNQPWGSSRTALNNTLPAPATNRNKRPLPADIVDPIARAMTGPPPPGADPVLPMPMATAAFGARSVGAVPKALIRPKPDGEIPVKCCFVCGRNGHDTLSRCKFGTRVKDGGKVVSEVRQNSRIFIITTDDQCCNVNLFNPSGCLSAACSLWHGCCLCESALHHPAKCHLLERNQRALRPSDRLDIALPQVEPLPPHLHPAYVRDVWEASGRFPKPPVVSGVKPFGTKIGRTRLDTPLGPRPDVLVKTTFRAGSLSLQAQELLGTAFPEHYSRITRGNEYVTSLGEEYAQKANVEPVLSRVIRQNRFKKAPSLAKIRALAATEKVAYDNWFAEFRAEEDRLKLGRWVEATEQAIEAVDRLQYPDGVLSIARLVIFGHYPVGQRSPNAFTLAAFSTALMRSLGLPSAEESGDYRVAYTNCLPVHFRAEEKTTPTYSAPAGEKGRSLPASLTRSYVKFAQDRLTQLVKTPGHRLVVTYGAEMMRVVEAVYDELTDEDGVTKWKWSRVGPAPLPAETGEDESVNTVLRALSRGSGTSPYPTPNEDPQRHFRTLLERWESGHADRNGDGKARWSHLTNIRFAVFNSEHDHASTVCISVPHPQNAAIRTGALDNAASMNIASQYAVDFLRGALAADDGYDAPAWPFVRALYNTKDAARGDSAITSKSRRALDYRLGQLETQQRDISAKRKSRFRFALMDLEPAARNLYADIEFCDQDQAGAEPMPFEYGDVVAAVRWLLRKRNSRHSVAPAEGPEALEPDTVG